MSAPARTAASSRSAVPGSRRMPDCGNATTCTSARPACACRAASTPSSRSSPQSVSTWTWLRTVVAPEAIVAPSVLVARSLTEPPALRQFARSLLISAGKARPGGVRAERQAEACRVEMGVGIGERRQQHTAPAVGDRHTRRRLASGDPAIVGSRRRPGYRQARAATAERPAAADLPPLQSFRPETSGARLRFHRTHRASRPPW